MRLRSWLVIVAVLGAWACGNAASPDDGDGTNLPVGAPGAGGSGALPVAGTGPAPGATAGAGSMPVGVSAGAGVTEPPGGVPQAGAGAGMAGAGAIIPTDPTLPPGSFDYQDQQVTLSADLVIAAGATVRVGPGVTFTGSGDLKVQVEGTLIITGTPEAPAKFMGAGTPRSWHGIVIASGGRLEATNVEIGGATYGIHAMPGSTFMVDHADLGTSFKAAVLQAEGSFDHTRFHASGDPTFSPVNEVSIDDVNGTLTIIDASPSVKNSSFDGSNALVDMVRIGGSSSATFDHVTVADAHCGFHTFGTNNASPKITNSRFERLSYGIMAYTSKPIIEDSVFVSNGNDVGFCFGATADNAPALHNNNYSTGAPVIDPTCFDIGTDEPMPAASPNPAAGPVGL